MIREALDRGKTPEQIAEEEAAREEYVPKNDGVMGSDRRLDMPYETIKFVFKEFDTVYDL
jgi:hypothetical protein